jgi:hypothetical protein
MTARTRALAALTLAAAMLLGAAVPALAWESQGDGLPGPVGDPIAYRVGHDATGWHLLTSGPGPRHHFTGVLTTDGRFTDVQLVRPERPESVRLLDGGHTLRFSVETWDAHDGVHFRVDGGSRVTFYLEVDGHRIAPSHVYLGAAGVHPQHNPFTIRR